MTMQATDTKRCVFLSNSARQMTIQAIDPITIQAIDPIAIQAIDMPLTQKGVCVCVCVFNLVNVPSSARWLFQLRYRMPYVAFLECIVVGSITRNHRETQT